MRNLALTALWILVAVLLALPFPQRLAGQSTPQKPPDTKATKATSAPAKPAPKAKAPAAPSTCALEPPIHLRVQTNGDIVAKLLMKMFPDFVVVVAPDSKTGSTLNVVDGTVDEKECKKKGWVTKLSRKELDGASALLDDENFQGATFDPKYLIRLRNLKADGVVQNLPYPTALLRLWKASGEYVLPIPVEGGRAKATNDDALPQLATKIRHDLEAVDEQYASVKDGKDAADLLAGVKKAKDQNNSDSASLLLAGWMSRHTITFSVLDPRDVILAFQRNFGDANSMLFPLVAQHAVAILPNDPTTSSDVWLAAKGLEKNVLLAGTNRAQQESSGGDNSNANQDPAQAKKDPAVAASNDTQKNDGSSQTRVVRLYQMREASTIATAINTMAPAGTSLVVALDTDQLLILPGPSDQQDRIRRLIALLDLPRPQVALQVWSYQISSDVKDENQRAHDVQQGFEGFRTRVSRANEVMTTALAAGMGAVEAQARVEGYFDQTFKQYLTSNYADCVSSDAYCLGYRNALTVPAATGQQSSASPSLARFLLLLAAAKDGQTIANTITAMEKSMSDPAAGGLKFVRFFKQLDALSQPANLHVIRAAILDFFFQYKLANDYPKDFSPYGLEQAAHALDSLLSPVIDAFNQDVDEYVESALRSLQAADKNTASVLFGEVQVTTISGRQATVIGKVNNYFDITEPPTLSDLLNNVSSTSSTGGLGPALQKILTPKEMEIAQFIANANTQPKVFSQVSKDASLTITPTSLDNASSAELDVQFDAKDSGDPTTVNQSSDKKDLLDRVAEHQVKDQVRVESLKLFEISSFTMQLTHKSQPKCWAYSPFCVVWKAVFGSVPGLDNLFEITPHPQTKDNRSAALVRAVVVPTAMDLGLSVRYDYDRIADPVTHTAIAAKSVSQLNGNIFSFHKELMSCLVRGPKEPAKTCLEEVPLSKTLEDAPRN